MSYDQNPGHSYQGPYQQQPQDPYQPQGYQAREAHPQEPLYPLYPHQQQVGTYVPVMYVAKVPGSAVGPLTLGIIGLLLVVLGLSLPIGGGFFGFIGFVLTFIGLPIAIVTLVRRIRAKLSLGIPIAAVATNGFLVVILLAAIIATAGS
jgi:hypothetical protein